jgi:hypothetical protein
MTNSSKVLGEERLLPPPVHDNLLKRYGVSRSFIDKVMFYSAFINDRLIIVHGNKIYVLDPATGYCQATRELPMGGVIKLAVAAGRVYVVSSSLDRINVFNSSLEPLNDIPLGFIEKNAVKLPELFFMNKYLLLRYAANLFIIDGESGQLKYASRLDDPDYDCIETHRDRLLIITPFRKAAAYRVGENSLQLDWEFALPYRAQDFRLLKYARFERYYFIADGNILLPFKENGDFGVASLSLETGRQLWRIPLRQIQGQPRGISDFITPGNEIDFVISTGCGGVSSDKMNDCCVSRAIDIEHVLLGLNTANGSIVRTQRLPSLMEFPSVQTSAALAETQHCLVYDVNGNIEASIKKRDE